MTKMLRKKGSNKASYNSLQYYFNHERCLIQALVGRYFLAQDPSWFRPLNTKDNLLNTGDFRVVGKWAVWAKN